MWGISLQSGCIQFSKLHNTLRYIFSHAVVEQDWFVTSASLAVCRLSHLSTKVHSTASQMATLVYCTTTLWALIKRSALQREQGSMDHRVWFKVVHFKGNRVPFWTEPKSSYQYWWLLVCFSNEIPCAFYDVFQMIQWIVLCVLLQGVPCLSHV